MVQTALNHVETSRPSRRVIYDVRREETSRIFLDFDWRINGVTIAVDFPIFTGSYFEKRFVTIDEPTLILSFNGICDNYLDIIDC